MKIKKLILALFFFGLAGCLLSLAIVIFATGQGFHGQDLLIKNTNNIFIKYSMAFFSLSCAILCIAFPILISKGLILIDYNNATKYSKAKNNFSIITLTLSFSPPSLSIWRILILSFSSSSLMYSSASTPS